MNGSALCRCGHAKYLHLNRLETLFHFRARAVGTCLLCRGPDCEHAFSRSARESKAEASRTVGADGYPSAGPSVSADKTRGGDPP